MIYADTLNENIDFVYNLSLSNGNDSLYAMEERAAKITGSMWSDKSK